MRIFTFGMSVDEGGTFHWYEPGDAGTAVARTENTVSFLNCSIIMESTIELFHVMETEEPAMYDPPLTGEVSVTTGPPIYDMLLKSILSAHCTLSIKGLRL